MTVHGNEDENWFLQFNYLKNKTDFDQVIYREWELLASMKCVKSMQKVW